MLRVPCRKPNEPPLSSRPLGGRSDNRGCVLAGSYVELTDWIISGVWFRIILHGEYLVVEESRFRGRVETQFL